MLKTQNITKEYQKDKPILKNINIIFRKNEFVSILGESGSGKSTFLNILGCLDTKYQGELFLNNKNITKRNKKYYDKLHNKKIGFVFQNYNLIDNYSVYKNIEIVLLIGKKKNKKEQIHKILTKIGLLNKKNELVKNLSGGEKQRIAIARALINDPDIILLDEPTGALDSKTSIEIMNLIKELSQNKLVIMVTHNEYIAKHYSTRIITIKDGEFISDTNPCIKEKTEEEQNKNKVGLSLINSLRISIKNLKLKPIRNILTILGFSISLIGILLVFSISSGFTNQIDLLKQNTLNNYPIVINSKVENKEKNDNVIKKYKTKNINNIDNNIIEYISKINTNNLLGITYNYEYKFNVISKNNNIYKYSNNLPFIAIPNDNEYLEKNYKVITGKLPENENEILIKLDNNNYINEELINLFDIENETITTEELLNKEIKIVLNNNLYQKNNETYIANSIDENLYNKQDNITLKVVGIIKSKDELEFNTLINEEGGAIYYKNDLIKKVITINKKSEIVKNQIEKDYNIFTKEKINMEQKKELLNSLGQEEYPFLIYIYPKNYESKEKIINYLKNFDYKKYNIEYTDLSEELINNFKTIILSITTILMIFSLISLIVTLVLISIITYTSILERKKEIGIFKSIGARNKDIKNIFTNENIIISLISSFIAVLLIKISLNIINKFLYSLTELKDLMILSNDKIIIVFIISILISFLGSILPLRKLNNTNVVENLK